MQLMTDEPERRFAAGEVLLAGLPVGRAVTVERSRWQGRQMIVKFSGVSDREQAGALRGALLEVDVPLDEQPSGDSDEYFDRTLVGLAVVDDASGKVIGFVREVLHLPGQDLLVLPGLVGESKPGEEPNAGETQDILIPFVAEIVKEVDPPGGQIRVVPPGGLVPGIGHSSEIAEGDSS